jgi:probable rRNA maturation factor
MSDFEIDVQIFDEFESAVSEQWVREIVSAAVESESSGPETQISVVIADDEVVRDLNRQHRGLDENTDVLSFSFTHQGEYYGDEERDAVADDEDFVLPPDMSNVESLGEIIISHPQTKRQAEQAGHTVEKELTVLLIHGVLHLLGHDHEESDDEVVMKAAEARVIAHSKSRNAVD